MGTTGAAAKRSTNGGRQAARRVAQSEPMRVSARAGFMVRTLFYLVLAGLVARTAFDGGTAGRQTNANGALSVIAQTVVGKVAIGAAALGFLLLGVERLAG